MRAPTWQVGLSLGLAALFLDLLRPLAGFLLLPHALFAIACFAVLSGDAKPRGLQARRLALAGLAAGALGLLLTFAANALANASAASGQWATWRTTLPLMALAQTGIAAGFYLAPQHLASARSRTLLGVALGAAVATAALALLQAQGPADALVAASAQQPGAPGSAEHQLWAQQALGAFYEATAAANQATTVASILFAWAYATIFGRLRAEGKPRDPWRL